MSTTRRPPLRGWHQIHAAILCLAVTATGAHGRPAVRAGAAAAPALLRVSPENPRYLEYRGKPVLLISSAEHYGAVINLDFDFRRYLDALKQYGLNHTRLWTGFYVENPTVFNITDNTLAPAANRYLPPWARSTEPGYANGGNKFDLSQWNPAFWARLKTYLSEAARRDVIVEIVLFCPFYNEAIWRVSPLHPVNNVNGLAEGLSRAQIYQLRDPRLTAFQDDYVRKVVREVNGFDNIYFELVNEPYAYDRMVPDAFERRIAQVIVETERALPKQHLIAQNISNGSRKVESPNPAVSILNFHYAAPPTAVALNYGLGRVIADDETGFRGQADLPYRLEAWNFMLAGGGIFSHLDFSFTAARPAGTFVPLPATQPGGGGPEFRRQMRVLARFMNSLPFVRMQPREDIVDVRAIGDLQVRALAEEGRQYAIYVSLADRGRIPNRPDPLHNLTGLVVPLREVTVPITLPPGRYEALWISPVTGQTIKRESFRHAGGPRALASPRFRADVALRIDRG